jgi:hypothetical protein
LGRVPSVVEGCRSRRAALRASGDLPDPTQGES